MTAFKCQESTKNKVALFEEADQKFKKAWEVFETEHATQLADLEKLREERNVRLDDAKRGLRAELETITEFRATFTEGPFKIQKKFSDFYIPEKLVAMLNERGLYDTAIRAKIIAIKVETAKFDEVKNFLRAHNIEKEFECCEDGVDAPGAIMGPKSVPPFGSELKKE